MEGAEVNEARLAEGLKISSANVANRSSNRNNSLTTTVALNILQRSTPDLPSARSTNGMSQIKSAPGDPHFDPNLTATGRLQFSRSFTERGERYPGGQGRKMSSNALDTKHIRLYLRRQNSRGSINSASTSLAGGETFSIASRPVSAESTATVHDVVNRFNNAVNTVVVIPNQPNRVFPPPFARSSSIPALGSARSKHFEKIVCQVLDYLYMGGIEAAYNANLLCRLNIEYLIDISNVEPQKVPRNKKSDCPCLCSLETAHSRARMTITIDEHSNMDLIRCFKDVNQFIESARACGKSVLIHSYHGRNRCAVLVLQYLMMVKRINLERAEQLLKSMWPLVCISENFYRSLKQWEANFVVRENDNGTVDTDSAGNSLVNSGPSFIKKSAWM